MNRTTARRSTRFIAFGLAASTGVALAFTSATGASAGPNPNIPNIPNITIPQLNTMLRISGPDTISINVDDTLIRKREIIQQIDAIKAKILQGNWPPL